MGLLYNKMFDIEINESLTISAKFLKEDNKLEISEKQDITDITNMISSASSTDSFDEDNEIIGYGKWFRNGKMSFKNVKYLDQKLLLSFDGCCDGKKVLGRLCIYHDNVTQQQTKKVKSIPMNNNNHNNQDSSDKDLDDEDDDEFFKINNDDDPYDDEDDDDEDDDDDDERISFIQMIIVSNILQIS